MADTLYESRIVEVRPVGYEYRDHAIERTAGPYIMDGWTLMQVSNRYYYPEVVLTFRRPIMAVPKYPARTARWHVFFVFAAWLGLSLPPIFRWHIAPSGLPYGVTGYVMLNVAIIWVGLSYWLARAKYYARQATVLLFGGILLGLSGITYALVFRKVFKIESTSIAAANVFDADQREAIETYVSGAIGLFFVTIGARCIGSALEKAERTD